MLILWMFKKVTLTALSSHGDICSLFLNEIYYVQEVYKTDIKRSSSNRRTNKTGDKQLGTEVQVAWDLPWAFHILNLTCKCFYFMRVSEV